MLRAISHPFIAPRLVAGQIRFSTGTPYLYGAKAEATSIVDNGSGDVSLTLGDPFARAPLLFSTPYDTSAGSISGAGATPTATEVRPASQNSAGTGVDSTTNFLAFGWDYPEEQSHEGHSFSVKSSLIDHRLISTIVDGANGECLTNFAQISGVKTDTGEYTFTFDRAFGQAPYVFATALGAACAVVNVNASAPGEVSVLVSDEDGSPVDQSFSLFVFGQDSRDSSGKNRRIIKCTQRLARLETFRISVTGGTPSLSIGSERGSVSDEGTGEYKITFTKPFARSPEVLCSSQVGRIVTTEQDSQELEVYAFTNAGSAVDPTSVDILVMGYDDAINY